MSCDTRRGPADSEVGDIEPDFDSLLGIEDEFYKEGYELGLSDGVQAGRAEGRVFGLEKGFLKFSEIANLHGQAIVLAQRQQVTDVSGNKTPDAKEKDVSCKLPALKGNPRLQKHIATLHALTDIDSMSLTNDDDAVSESDDRLKRALAKMTVIARLTGEHAQQKNEAAKQVTASAKDGGTIEDVNLVGARQSVGMEEI